MPTYGKRMLLGLLPPLLSQLPGVPGCAGARCSATVTLTLLTLSLRCPNLLSLSLLRALPKPPRISPTFPKSTYFRVFDKLFRTTLPILNTRRDSWQSLVVHFLPSGRHFAPLSSSCAQNVVYGSGWAGGMEAAHRTV